MNALNRIIILSISASVIGCATTSKDKILRNTLIAAGSGAAYGYNRQNYPISNAALYGATAAALTGIASLYLYDPDKETQKLKQETALLKEKIDQFEKPTLIDQGNSLFKSPFPPSLSKLVQPGEWKRYRIDQWVQDPNNQNIWIKQVEMYEIIPPSSGN